MTTMLLQPHHHHFVSMDAAVANLLGENFGRPFAAFDTSGARQDVAVDILQTDDELVFRAAVPGFAPEDINLVVLNGVLSLKGEHQVAEPHSSGQYLRQEMSVAAFDRSFELPFAVQADKAQAEFEHGILTVRLPKADEARPTQIKIAVQKPVEGQKLSD